MHRISIFFLILFLVVIAACTGSTSPEPPAVVDTPPVTTPAPLATATATDSTLAPTATPEPAIEASPTIEPEPTAAPAPTDAPASTATPIPEPTPVPVVFPPSISLEPFVSVPDQITYLTHAGDGSGRIFLVEKQGRVRIIEAGRVLETPFLDISELVESGGSEQGLLSIAFDPDYENNGEFYVNYTSRAGGGDTTIARYRVSGGTEYG